MDWRVLDENVESIELEVGDTSWLTSDGLYHLQEDLRVNGERWRIHKSDADPNPSNPHAHCVAGKHKGCKLHLGTRQLYAGSRPLDSLA
jgi:hypothetical protein